MIDDTIPQAACALAFDLGRENEQLADGVRTLGAENARLSARIGEAETADPQPTAPLTSEDYRAIMEADPTFGGATIGGVSFFPQPTDHCEHGFAPGMCPNVGDLCKQQIEAEAKRHEQLRTELARLRGIMADTVNAGTREIADLRAEAARCANAETVANGKLALAEAELRDAKATITKLGDEMRDLRDRFQAERTRRFELEREAVTAEEAYKRKYGGVDFLLDGIGDLEDKARLLLTEYNLTFADKEPKQ